MIVDSFLMFLTVLNVILCLLYAQRKHYEFLKSEKDQKNIDSIYNQMEGKMSELDELKKRVDSLTLRVGFKP